MNTRLPGLDLLDWTLSPPDLPDWHCSPCPAAILDDGYRVVAFSLSTSIAEAFGSRNWTIGWLSGSSSLDLKANIRSSNTRASTLIA